MAIDPTYYAFSYEAYDRKEPDEDGYSRKENEVTVTVMAESEETATKKAAKLVQREAYKLTGVVEVSDQYSPLVGSRF